MFTRGKCKINNIHLSSVSVLLNITEPLFFWLNSF